MVLEDVFPSDTYFEHTIQHGRGFLDELYSLYIVRRSSGGVSWAIRRFGRFNTMLSEMIGDWICQGAVDRRLEKKGVSFPVTPDDAVEVLESIGSMAPWHTWPRWMFTDIEKVLINIAKRRFAHLAS